MVRENITGGSGSENMLITSGSGVKKIITKSNRRIPYETKINGNQWIWREKIENEILTRRSIYEVLRGLNTAIGLKYIM